MKENASRIQSLQFLRGGACLFVMLCHTKYLHGFGQSGVDLFFVISGFVMMYSTQRGAEHYWKKRLKKIMPLYWGVTIFTSLLIILLPWLFNVSEVSVEYFWKSMLLIPYYHNGQAGPVMAWGWTLYYEMLFYLFFWIALKINYAKRGMITACICVIAVIAGGVLPLPMPFSYWTNPVIWEFVYGILIYGVWNYCGTHMKQLDYETIGYEKNGSASYVVMAYAIFLAGICGMEYLAQIEGLNRAFGTGICATLMVGCFLFLERNRNIKLPKWVIHIGNISYPLYLFHMFPVEFVDMVSGNFFPDNIVTSLIGVAVAVISTEILIWMFRFFQTKWRVLLNV